MAIRGRFRTGKFVPSKPEKYIGNLKEITWRSSWELKFMRWCDLNPSVVQWNSEGLHIPYYSQADQKMRKYHVDFVIRYKTPEGDLKTSLIEIKPDSQTRPPSNKGRKKPETYLAECHTYQVNMDKWRHAAAWAKKNDAEFRVMTEYDLGIARKRE